MDTKEKEKCPQCTKRCEGISLYECEECGEYHCNHCEKDEDSR